MTQPSLSTGLTPFLMMLLALFALTVQGCSSGGGSGSGSVAPVDRWTWVSGSNTIYQAGIYGTKGVADVANVPGGKVFRDV